MGQIKIYGLAHRLRPARERLSGVIHSCMVDALEYPQDKRFHRFFPMEPGDFLFPPERSDAYTVVEISMFVGRSMETKKRLIRLLYERTGRELGLDPMDLEITIIETPRPNWGIRGVPADELALGYKVNV